MHAIHAGARSSILKKAHSLNLAHKLTMSLAQIRCLLPTALHRLVGWLLRLLLSWLVVRPSVRPS